MQFKNLSLEKLSFFSLLITIILVPFFFIPLPSVTVDTAKTILLVLGGVISFSLYLIHVVKRGEFEYSSHRSIWAVVLVPIVFFASAILSHSPAMGLFGYNLEIGTWAFITLGFLLTFLVSVHFRTKERIFYSYLAFFVGFAIIALLALVKFFFGVEVPGVNFLTEASPSPLGSWTDVGVFAGASAILIFMALEEMALSTRSRGILWASFVISLFIMVVVNVQAVWIVSLIFSLVYLLFTFSLRAPVEASAERKLSYGALALLVISILFVFNPLVSSSGARLGDVLANRLSIANVTVRPTLEATYEVTRPVIKESPLFGSGPNTFGQSWLTHKPEGVNQTVFWNTPFEYGVGFLPTLIVTTGLLGGIVLLAFFALYILLGMRALFTPNEDRLGHFLTSSSFLLSLFMWAMMLAYVPSKAMLTLAFVFTGLFYASLAASGLIAKRVILFHNNSKLAFIAILLLVALLVGNVTYAYGAGRQSVASIYFQKAVRTAQAGDLGSAKALAIRATNMASEDIYFSGVSQISIAEANSILSSGTQPTEAETAQFQVALRDAITSSQLAIKLRPESYSNWITLGSLYESLVPPPLGVEGAYESAKDAYMTAMTKNPTSPEPHFLLGRLEASKQNMGEARNHIKEALALKSDYAEAYYLLTQIEAGENNVKEAIKSAQSLAMLAPENPGVLFQLGLLEYTDNNYPNALEAFSHALRISPDYANAKYFYGLTLAKMGEDERAIKIFEELQASNPDVTELAQIISNIKAGRDAVAGLEPSPEDRPTPPITNDTRTSN
ncbi:MAG: tetratricopeptide repeat protein [Parcubacteria group bacterium]